MPPQRKSKPLSRDHAALAQAIQSLIAEDWHMTQQSVAEDSGLSVKQVNEILRGQANPTFLNMLRLADGLRVSPGTLMTRVDELRAGQCAA